MPKTLCKLSGSVKKNLETIAALVDRPRFICTDCGRVANEKKRLCEAKRLPKPDRGEAEDDADASLP